MNSCRRCDIYPLYAVEPDLRRTALTLQALDYRRLRRTRVGNSPFMVLILALLLVLVLFGAGFALHVLWIAAVIFAVVWLVGFALGRGEGAGRHRFYRW